MLKNSYSGIEVISVNLYSPSLHVYIHGEDPLFIRNVSLLQPNSSILSYSYGIHNKVCIELPTELEGEITLEIMFDVTLNYKLYGSYTCISESGSMMSLTDFEPIFTRKAIPCFDEPNMKAKYQLKITVEDEYFVISNTNSAEITKINGKATYVFEETPLMSCYLLH